MSEHESSITSEKLEEAFRAHTRYRLSLRELAKRYGTSKSGLQRMFAQLKKTEVGVEGLSEIRGGEVSGASELVPVGADPAIQHLETEVTTLRTRVQRAEKFIALRNRKKELERKALELEARLDAAKLPAYVFTLIDEDYPELTLKIGRLCSVLGITPKEAIHQAFEDESYEELEYETFEDYVASHLRDWISAKEELLGEERKRAEEEKRAIELRRREELKGQIERLLPTLQCPLCVRAGKISSYAVVNGEFGYEIYFKCGNCALFFQPKWVVNPFGPDEVELYPTPFARIPDDSWDSGTSQSALTQ